VQQTEEAEEEDQNMTTDEHEHGGHGHGGHGHSPRWQESADPDPAVMWDQRFAEGEWSTEPDAELCALAGSLEPGTAVDLGGGNGRNAVWLAEQGWTVTCVDASSVGLDQAAQRAAANGSSLACEVADLRTWEPGGRRFDLVVLANIHMPADQRDRLFTMAQDAVAPGGRLFVVGHRVDSFGTDGHPHPERLFTEELLSTLIDQLEIDELRTVEHQADHGHVGIDIVAWAHRA